MAVLYRRLKSLHRLFSLSRLLSMAGRAVLALFLCSSLLLLLHLHVPHSSFRNPKVSNLNNVPNIADSLEIAEDSNPDIFEDPLIEENPIVQENPETRSLPDPSNFSLPLPLPLPHPHLLPLPLVKMSNISAEESVSVNSHNELIGAARTLRRVRLAETVRENIWPARKRRLDDHCWSKSEQYSYFRTFTNSPSSAFTEKLDAYIDLHAKCTNGVKNWHSFFYNETDKQRDGVPQNCRYSLVDFFMDGLGNRLQGMLSVFIFSILTDRVFLMDATLYKHLLCDPFEGRSSWWIPKKAFKRLMKVLPDEPRISQVLTNFNEGKSTPRAFLDVTGKFQKPDYPFFCDDSQAALEAVPLVMIKSGQYFANALWLMSRFRPELERLFPDRIVFSHLAHTILLPNNYLWERITRLSHKYLDDRLLGIQLRLRDPLGEAWADRCSRLAECALGRGLAPRPLPGREWEEAMRGEGEGEREGGRGAEMAGNHTSHPPTVETTSILVASLHREYFDFLQRLYAESPTEDGTFVTVHMESATGQQLRGNQDAAQEAFTEMWLLSFVDEIVTTDRSSFGYIAAGLGGLHAFHFSAERIPKKGRPVCARQISTEPCYFHPPLGLECRGWDDSRKPSYLVSCVDGKGIIVVN